MATPQVHINFILDRTCDIPYDEHLSIEWTDQSSPVTVNPFTSPSGPAVAISADPLQLFSLFFNSEVIDLIVTETKHPNAEQTVTPGRQMLRR